MRNLLEYPITSVEIEGCLIALADELATEGGVGDMRPLLLREAAKIVSRAVFVTSDIDRRPIKMRKVRVPVTSLGTQHL